ncbi:ankyrin repeat domain-containing protein [Magnetovibrio blakemorei]|uniref:Uncharacterized protein n=1 Tax=Magnetovibrio blakemorei TaxID=28181 RepID=A0A1E5QAD8_9PROT|nr:ankyrin repeat domain-containing protein [Magnetovibrio blakemorei]OEJ68894.1 hypothetical protein BEN30_05125 [Magnetovibrio blakemorei]
MPLKAVPAKRRFLCVPTRARAWYLLCAVSALGAVLNLPLSSPLLLSLAFVSPALAQQELSGATQELFLAVERNDLPGVQAAISKGADLQAHDYSGTQAVDVAIDQGFFEIAHYLISVRNTMQAQEKGGEVKAAPSAEELAQRAQFPAPPAAAPTTHVTPGIAVAPPPLPPLEGPDPFEVAQPTENLPIIGSVQEPLATEQPEVQQPESPQPETTSVRVFTPSASEQAAVEKAPGKPVPSALSKLAERTKKAPLSASKTVKMDEEIADPAAEPMAEPETAPVVKKPSAAWTFLSTFGNFFAPPNITGVTKEEKEQQIEADRLSEAELSAQLKQIEAELGNDVIRGPAVPISPDELAKELPLRELSPEELAALPKEDSGLPPYSVSSPASSTRSPSSGNPFGNLEIEDASAAPQIPMPSGPAIRLDPKAIRNNSTSSKPVSNPAPGVPTKSYDDSKPFGGGVDPDVLAYLGLDEHTGLPLDEQTLKEQAQKKAADAADKGLFAEVDPPSAPAKSAAKASPTQESAQEENPFAISASPANKQDVDPFAEPSPAASAETKDVDPFAAQPPAASAAEDDPFAVIADSKTPAVSDLLDNLNKPAPAAQNADDPFAVATAPKSAAADDENPFGGLLESSGKGPGGSQGWDVKKVEGADIPQEVIVLSDIKPTGAILDGVELTIGVDTKIGQEVGEKRMAMLDQVTIHKPCVAKDERETIFCIDTVNWPLDLSGEFEVDTIMYQGTRAIGRYDAGRATKFHTLFRTEAFERVVSYYIGRYGQPSETLVRAIAPLAAPRQENPTYLWQSRETGTDTMITLEIRKFDDALGGGFPDTERGVILLSRNDAKPIFPYLSQLELMVLKADVDAPPAPTADNPAAPGDIWN